MKRSTLRLAVLGAVICAASPGATAMVRAFVYAALVLLVLVGLAGYAVAELVKASVMGLV